MAYTVVEFEQNYRKKQFTVVFNSVPEIESESNLKKKIKSSLYSPYYAEACNELRGPSPRLSAWATQLRRSVATVASRWRHCADLTGPGIEPQTSRTDSVRFATELTAGAVKTHTTTQSRKRHCFPACCNLS